MNRLLLLLLLGIVSLRSYGQEDGNRSLHYYIETAKENSPLITDYRNQTEIEQSELERLKAMYTHSRLELNGDYLFVPIISKDGGRIAFKWNARSATDYYGYDLGESSGSLHAGATWTQPLLGRSSYKMAQEQAQINTDITNNRIRMEEHQLERSVTEQYLLCLLDKAQMDFTDSVGTVIDCRIEIVRKLVENGLSKQSDLNLLMIEREANAELHIAARQSYHTHLMDLNLLCGIDDATDVALSEINLSVRLRSDREPSLFTEQYRLDSLNTAVSLRSFNLQYKPKLDLFVNGGLQVGDFSGWYRHFGWGAGLTFSWTIFDGRQKRWKERQSGWQQNSIQTYKDNSEYQRNMRIRQCLSELGKYDERERALENQLAEYESVLSDYGKELNVGQVSVLDYITVLRSKIQTEKERLLLRTNKQLVIAAYNYWNW
ncbi:TolC family protein [Bacteroides zhangwenhongii]|uniref:TolC family protein n=1 Tax=Bacteroides zhangwenhongii TaxID=2650157 RepID=UPI003AAC68B2